MPIVADAAVKIGADFSTFGRDLDRGTTQPIQSLGQRIKGALSPQNLAIAGVAGATAAIGLFTAGLVGAVKSLIDIERLNAQTSAAIRSTGGAANVTVGDIEALSESMESLTTIERETVQEGANMLLTFTRVRNVVGAGNDIFNQATEAALDMSVALGTDATSAAMMLGKALNDPVKGMTAMTRAGIQFTEQQKDMIQAMVAAGDLLGAQKIILAELETQFGGSAEAFANTTAGKIQRFHNEVGNMFESIIVGAVKVADFLGQDIIPFKDIERDAGLAAASIAMEMPRAIASMQDALVLGGPIIAAEAGKIAGMLPSEISARVEEIRQAGLDNITAFADSLIDNRQMVVDAALGLADDIETGLTAAETIAALTGADVVTSLQTGLGSDDEGIRLMAKGRLSLIMDELNKLGPAGSAAGKALMDQLSWSIDANAGTPTAAARRAAGNIRGVFPHSEPKDPQSPLRGWTHLGADMMTMLAGNIDGSGVASAIRRSLSGAMSLGAPLGVSAGSGGPGSAVGAGMTININAPTTPMTPRDIGRELRRTGAFGVNT